MDSLRSSALLRALCGPLFGPKGRREVAKTAEFFIYYGGADGNGNLSDDF
jgi:hypothetical protein